MKNLTILFTFLIPLILSAAILEKEVPENKSGNEKFKKQKFDEAEKEFLKGSKRVDKSGELLYNLGNAQYKSGKFEDAIKSYEGSLATLPEDSAFKSDIYHNLGNSYFSTKNMRMLKNSTSKA